MANYNLKNGNLTSFTGTNPYTLVGTSGEYAQSASGQTFNLTSAYTLVGAFSASGSITVTIMIFDVNGIPMSNQLVFALNSSGGLAIAGDLLPTKTAVGTIRVMLSPASVNTVTGLAFTMDETCIAITQTCPFCSGNSDIGFNTAQPVATAALGQTCGLCGKRLRTSIEYVLGRPMKSASVVLVGKSN